VSWECLNYLGTMILTALFWKVGLFVLPTRICRSMTLTNHEDLQDLWAMEALGTKSVKFIAWVKYQTLSKYVFLVV